MGKVCLENTTDALYTKCLKTYEIIITLLCEFKLNYYLNSIMIIVYIVKQLHSAITDKDYSKKGYLE